MARPSCGQALFYRLFLLRHGGDIDAKVSAVVAELLPEAVGERRATLRAT